VRARVLADASRRSLMRGHIDRERSLKIPGKKPQLRRNFEFLERKPRSERSQIDTMTIKNARAFYKTRRSLREGRRGGLMTLASARRPRIPAESLAERRNAAPAFRHATRDST